MSLIGSKTINKVFLGTKEVTDIFVGANKVYSSGPSVDPVLNNNDWATIRAVCEAGDAANYWAVGDTKTDVGTDSTTRTFQLVDLQGLYNKHAVFLQVELEDSVYVWDADNNNNYSISDVRNTHLPAIMAKYSSALQTNLTNTTYKVATNGNDGTILDLTDKLFLPAEKELFGVRTYSRTEEVGTLIQYQYFSINSDNSYRIKIKDGARAIWWERSPAANTSDRVCRVGGNGAASRGGVTDSYSFAPAFAL